MHFNKPPKIIQKDDEIQMFGVQRHHLSMIVPRSLLQELFATGQCGLFKIKNNTIHYGSEGAPHHFSIDITDELKVALGI